MGERRQFSPRCLVDGLFALDNAVSKEAASHKGISGPVAGAAESKFLSIALGVYLTAVERHLKLKIGRVHF